MLRRILSRLQQGILAHPGWVVAGSAVLVVAALFVGRNVEFRTSRSDLVPRDDPDQMRFDQLTRDSGEPDPLIVCVEAAPGEAKTFAELTGFADRVAAAVSGAPLVSQVFHKVDLDWFVEHGLYLVPPARLLRIVDAARTEKALLDRLDGVRDLAALNGLLADRLETGVREGAAVPEDGGEAVSLLGHLLAWERQFLESPSSVLDPLEGVPPLLALAADRPGARMGGYLATHDESTLFLIVTPRDEDDSVPAQRRFLESVRERADRVLSATPGFRIAYTGRPAQNVEEMATIRRDSWFSSIMAALGVSVLTVLAFRWKTHAFLVLAALGTGIAWSFGAVWLELGYLNLITSAFVSTLVGVGVAYGIHPVSEYELEGAHTRDPIGAVRESYHRTGAAVTVAATTTGVAFLSILLMDFRGFAELGLVAGVGVFLCLIASLVTLPALLALYGRWRGRRDRSERREPPTAVVDRLWVEHGAPRVCRFPRTVTALAVLATAGLAWSARDIGFDIDILDLLPRDAESLRYQRRMVMDSDLSPAYNIVVADDVAGLRELAARAEVEPTIGRFESVLSYLPEEPGVSATAVSQIANLLEGVSLPDAPRPLEADAVVRSLGRLESVLADAADAAFGAGLGDLAGEIESARAEAEAARSVAESATPALRDRWNRGQDRLLEMSREVLSDLRRASSASAPDLDNLPPSIRKRFLTRSGRLIGLLHPKESIFEWKTLTPYVEASRRVSPEVTGFPLLFHRMATRINSGFQRAVMVGSVLMLVILLLDYRNVRDTFLAVIPLAMGVIWMLGGMRLLGISYNFANMIGVPLILGVGIDNGVHVIHRVRHEGSEGMATVLRHTGRAILIASLTTMIGFGSLALASHRGLASLGQILLLGVGACLIASTLVLPNVLVGLGIVKR